MSTSSSRTRQPAVSTSYGVPRLEASSVVVPPTSRPRAVPPTSVCSSGWPGAGSHGVTAPSQRVEQARARVVAGLVQLVEHRPPQRREPRQPLQRQVQQRDVAHPHERLGIGRHPVEVQERDHVPAAVAASQLEHHVDAGLLERPLQVGRPFLRAARQVAAAAAHVGRLHHPQAGVLEERHAGPHGLGVGGRRRRRHHSNGQVQARQGADHRTGPGRGPTRRGPPVPVLPPASRRSPRGCGSRRGCDPRVRR